MAYIICFLISERKPDTSKRGKGVWHSSAISASVFPGKTMFRQMQILHSHCIVGSKGMDKRRREEKEGKETRVQAKMATESVHFSSCCYGSKTAAAQILSSLA